MIRWIWFPILWCLVLTSAAGGEPGTVQDWLARMNRAIAGLDYQGQFVYLHGSHLETMHIRHTVKDGREQERLVSLNGAIMELIRDDQSITCISPEAGPMTVDRPGVHKRFPSLLPADVSGLTRYYEFHHLERCRIAGRYCRVIAVVPTDTYRYGHRLFLDEETALPLKSDLMDEHRSPVAQIMFTSLQVTKRPDSRSQTTQLLKVQPGDARAGSTANAAGLSGWRFGWLPEGFKPSADNHWVDPNDGAKVEQIVLSDGLASMSVYIEHIGQSLADNLSGGSTVGAVNAWGRTHGSHQITGVGEVPLKTVRRVVEEIEPTGSD